MFIEGQGYTVDNNIVYQDNKSPILLAVNGRFSSSKRTKHIRARYFLVKDLIARVEMEVRHESTIKMWSNVLTKPLQGQGFRVFRARLMNVPEMYDDEVEAKQTHPSLLPTDLERPDPVVLRKISPIQVQPMNCKIAIANPRRSVLGEARLRAGVKNKTKQVSFGTDGRATVRRNSPTLRQ